MKKFIQLGYDAGTGFHHVNGVESVKPQQENLVFGSGMYEYAPAGVIEIEVNDNTGQLIQPEKKTPELPAEYYAMKSRSDAWYSVAAELSKHNENFMCGPGTGLQCTLRYINELAEKAKKYDAIVQALGS